MALLVVGGGGLHRLAVHQHPGFLRADAPELQGAAAAGGQEAPVALRRLDRKAALRPGHTGHRAGSALPGGADAVVLVEVEGALRPGKDLDPQGRGVAGAVGVGFQPGHGQDGPRPGQHRDVLDAAVQGQLAAAVVDPAVEQIEPLALRQPGREGGRPRLFVHGGGDGAGDQLGAEIVFIGSLVGLGPLRLQVIQGADQGLALAAGVIVHGVQVGHQLVPQPEIALHHSLGNGVIVPGFLAGKVAAGAVEPQDGREHPELHPAGGQLVVPVALHMAADVVAPPAVAYVAGVGGEVGLEGQGLPADDGIPRKAHRVTVAARAGVAGEGQAPPALPHAVQKVVVVQHPQGVQAGDAGPGALLPVQPPEVHAGLLVGVVEVLEISVHEAGVGDVELHRLFLLPVLAQGLGHGAVGLLKGADAVGGVDVQGHPQAMPVQPGHKLRRVGEELFVPGIAGPAAAVLRVHVHQVPVHVDDRHREGHLLGFKPLHQGLILRLVVAVEAAPPVAQSVAGQHRRRAGQVIKIPQAGLVVAAVAEEVEVDALALPGLHPAVGADQQGAAVVQQAVAAPVGQQAVLQLHRAVGVVQGAGGAPQVAGLLPIVPHAVVGVALRLDRQGQPAGGELLLVVQQHHPFGDDLEGAVRLEHPKLRHREIPVQNALGGPVLKHAVLAVFQPEQPGRQDGDAVFFSLHHRLLCTQGAAGKLPPFHSPSSFLFCSSCVLHCPYYSRLTRRRKAKFHIVSALLPPCLLRKICALMQQNAPACFLQTGAFSALF